MEFIIALRKISNCDIGTTFANFLYGHWHITLGYTEFLLCVFLSLEPAYSPADSLMATASFLSTGNISHFNT